MFLLGVLICIVMYAAFPLIPFIVGGICFVYILRLPLFYILWVLFESDWYYFTVNVYLWVICGIFVWIKVCGKPGQLGLFYRDYYIIFIRRVPWGPERGKRSFETCPFFPRLFGAHRCAGRCGGYTWHDRCIECEIQVIPGSN